MNELTFLLQISSSLFALCAFVYIFIYSRPKTSLWFGLAAFVMASVAATLLSLGAPLLIFAGLAQYRDLLVAGDVQATAVAQIGAFASLVIEELSKLGVIYFLLIKSNKPINFDGIIAVGLMFGIVETILLIIPDLDSAHFFSRDNYVFLSERAITVVMHATTSGLIGLYSLRREFVGGLVFATGAHLMYNYFAVPLFNVFEISEAASVQPSVAVLMLISIVLFLVWRTKLKNAI